MSRPRRYPVGGDTGPIPADKPTPTKSQLLVIVDTARDPMTRPAILLAAARLFDVQPPGQRADDGTRWARQVMDYPAAERLLDRMEIDGLITGSEAWEWAAIGHRIGGAQAGTTYFFTARQALALRGRNEQHRDDVLWEQAATAADGMLRTLHTEQWERLREEAYAALQKGVTVPQPDAQESS